MIEATIKKGLTAQRLRDASKDLDALKTGERYFWGRITFSTHITSISDKVIHINRHDEHFHKQLYALAIKVLEKEIKVLKEELGFAEIAKGAK